MRRTLVRTVALTGLVSALVASPAQVGAITNGSPDTGHPNVGAIAVDLDYGFGTHRELLCSGSLLTEDVFLTAGHCVDALEFFLSQAWMSGADDVWVSFDADLNADPDWLFGVDPDNVVPVADWFLDPAFRCNTSTCYHDYAVLKLARDVGLAPIALPPLGFLDQAAASGQLRGHSFVNVGYGVNGFDRSRLSPTAEWIFDGLRKVSRSPFMSLTPQQLFLLENHAATGEGGQCSGDSGSPKFFTESGQYANTAVGVATSGDPGCKTLSQSGRLDIPAARDFLAQFVDVP